MIVDRTAVGGTAFSRWIACAVLACAAVASASCDAGDGTAVEPRDAELEGSPARGAAVDRQAVLTFAEGSAVGESQIVRTPGGVDFRVSTTDLETGHAYTLWFVVFNDPTGCAAPTPVSDCGPTDVVNPDAEPDMAYAAGSVVGASGQATFAGSMRVSPLEGSVNEPVDLPAYGLTSPLAAEIQLVVHHHGPMLPAYMPDMIQSIDGGCTDAGVPEAGVPSPWNEHEYARRGPNTCASVQFSAHPS